MARKKPTKQSTNIDYAAIDAAYQAAIEADADTPWSPAWIAARMARNDLRMVRVQDQEGCCNGQRCMHFVNTAKRRVLGKDAPAATGNAIADDDGSLFMRGLGRFL